MFDNLGTALVQALGFFAVFGFFVYQTLFADRKPKNSKSNFKKTKISDTKEAIKKESKKGLFNRKSKPGEENLPVQKKGYFFLEKRLSSQLRNYFSIIKIKLMKPIRTSCALILGALTLFSISNANAGGCSTPTEKKAEIECLSEDKKCIDTKEKESLYKVEV